MKRFHNRVRRRGCWCSRSIRTCMRFLSMFKRCLSTSLQRQRNITITQVIDENIKGYCLLEDFEKKRNLRRWSTENFRWRDLYERRAAYRIWLITSLGHKHSIRIQYNTTNIAYECRNRSLRSRQNCGFCLINSSVLGGNVMNQNTVTKYP